MAEPQTEITAANFEALRERILEQYLRGELAREQAIELVGIDCVDLAERQCAAMREDLAWAQSD